MGGRHTHPLHVHGHGPVHRLAPEVKVAAAFAFVAAVAVTPREAVWAFAIDLALVVTVIAVGRLPVRFVLARLAVALPFIAFAFTLPFIGGGERIEVAGLLVSRDGLWGMWNILAKATIGVSAAVVLSGTTEPVAILRGMQRLRVPPTLVAIASFMLRYLELIADEFRRTRTAMTARSYDPRWITQVRPLASSVGALFVRSYERGERVHSAMLARGFDGALPLLDDRRAGAGAWAAGAVLPAVAAAAAVAAHLGGAA